MQWKSGRNASTSRPRSGNEAFIGMSKHQASAFIGLVRELVLMMKFLVASVLMLCVVGVVFILKR